MTEHNLFQEIEAELEHQKYEELWKKYGIWIAFAAVLAIAVTGGISWWRSWHAAQDQQATVALFQIVDKADDVSKAPQELDDLQKYLKTSPGATHEVYAKLDAAGIAAKSGDAKGAVVLYDAVANDSSVESVFRQFATLMSVRTQMDTGDAKELEKRLEPIVTDDVPWHYTALEYEGFLAFKSGDKDKAKQIFAELSQDARVPDTLGARAADMLHFISE